MLNHFRGCRGNTEGGHVNEEAIANMSSEECKEVVEEKGSEGKRQGTEWKGPVRQGTECVEVHHLMEKDNPLDVTGRMREIGKDRVYGYTPRATPGYLSSS